MGYIVDETYETELPKSNTITGKVSDYYGVSKNGGKIIIGIIGFILMIVTVAIIAIANIKITVPNVVGMNYRDALDTYSTQGGPSGGSLIFDEIDGLGNRNVWVESNWKICNQRTPAGAKVGLFHTVHVTVVKTNESCTKEIKPKPQPSPTETSQVAAGDSSPRKWWPQGFEYFSDEVATRFVEGQCDYGSWCWNLEVVTKYGCSNLYVEMNVFDSNMSVVDWTNDTARNVNGGEVVRLQLNTYHDSASKGRITDISCY